MLKKFELKEEHVKLVSSMYVSWQNCETGAPEINPKRPYGNSDVPSDIHFILTGDYPDELSEELEDKYMTLHEETKTALQIILHTKSFEVGTYILNVYGKEWRREF